MIKTPVQRHQTVNRVVRQPDTMLAILERNPELETAPREADFQLHANLASPPP